MKRFRLSTLMLLIVIAALCIALVVQHRRVAELETRLFVSEFAIKYLARKRTVERDAHNSTINMKGKSIRE
jgi:hypothetical protein